MSHDSIKNGTKSGIHYIMITNSFRLSSGDVQLSEVKTIYTLSGRLKEISNWLVSIMLSGDLEAIFPASTREYSHYVDELWKDPAIKATYKRRSEIESFPRAASYFLERVRFRSTYTVSKVFRNHSCLI